MLFWFVRSRTECYKHVRMNTVAYLQGEVAFNFRFANRRLEWSRTFALLAAVFLLGFSSAPAQARVIYVNGALQTDPVPTGQTWATAWNTIGDAVNEASEGDEIWVAQGTYKEFVVITNAVALYGGFVGTETNRDQRNFTANTTTIYGEGGGAVIRQDVVTIAGFTNDMARLDGFTVNKDSKVFGSAICSSNASPVIANNQVCGLTNFIYGVIQCRGGAPLIVSNYVAYNETASVLIAGINYTSSGGIYSHDSDAHILANQILWNKATLCSGIYIDYGSSLIEFNDIVGNSADIGSGGVDCWLSCVRLFSNKIVGNMVTAANGVSFGAGIYASKCTNSWIANNLIMANFQTSFPLSGNGAAGGIFCDQYVTGTIINNTILNNLGGASGLWCGSAQVVVLNNIIAFNSTGVGGISNIQFTNNCVYGNATNYYVKIPDLTGTNGNISLDPKLDGNAQRPGWHLMPGSPCIGTGDISLVSPDWRDIDGEPRIQDSHVDIGADTFQADYSPAPPLIIYVSPTGDDHNDGLSWTTALRSVQTSMDRAVLTPKDIWVSEGTYHERIVMRALVNLFGGFSGVETNQDQRDWSRNATILDGQGLGSVVQMKFLPGLIRLDGFTIQNGRAPTGGGVLARLCSPFIANSIIQSNSTYPSSGITTSGGGVHSERCSLVLSNNLIQRNDARSGGGVSMRSDTGDIVVKNTFESNRALQTESSTYEDTGGAGLWATESRTMILNNLFHSNICTNQTRWMNLTAYGGAIYFRQGYANSFGTSTICNNSFIGNKTASCNESGGIALRVTMNTLFANNLFAYNSSGIYCSSITNIQFLNNCVFSNTAFNYNGLTSPTGTNGNISVDPLFIPGTYQLSSNSPCIDAGNDSVITPDMLDLLGAPRLQGAHVDIGAYEYAATGDWTSFVPGGELVHVTPVTVGGITYVQWQFEFSESKYRMIEPGTVNTDGTNIACRFNLEKWSGAETPGTNVLAGTFVLGALSPVDYTLGVSVSGTEVKTVPFSISAEKASTLSWQQRSEGALKLQVLGVADVTYRLLCGTNLMNWEILSTHRGAPFELEVTNNADIPTLFYRVEIVK